MDTGMDTYGDANSLQYIFVREPTKTTTNLTHNR